MKERGVDYEEGRLRRELPSQGIDVVIKPKEGNSPNACVMITISFVRVACMRRTTTLGKREREGRGKYIRPWEVHWGIVEKKKTYRLLDTIAC